MKNRTASEAYNEHVERARRNLKWIMEGLGTHIARAATTPAGTYAATSDWGEVQDLERLNELLDEAARFINSEGE